MLKYAVVGTGWITGEFIKGASLVPGMKLEAVYSRSASRGESFAALTGAPFWFTDLDEMARSGVDAVYIASPNICHFHQSEIFLKNGKHVICEKPATVTPDALARLQELAARKNLVYTEAIMYMFSPVRNTLKSALERLGKISGARLDFSQLSSKYEALKRGEKPNIFNREVAAGCFMDLGCYCVCPALDLFGEPAAVSASSGFLPDGTDVYGAAVFDYADKQIALTYSKIAQDRCGSQILGDEGTLTIESLSKLTNIKLFTKNGAVETLAGETEKHVIMGYEAKAFYDFITKPELSKNTYRDVSALSMKTARAMETVRRLAGINPAKNE